MLMTEELYAETMTMPQNNIYIVPSSERHALECLNELSAGKYIAVSVESAEIDARTGPVRMIGLATEKHTIPVLFDLDEMTDHTRKRIAVLLKGDQIKVAYDWSIIGVSLASAGFEVLGVMFDVLLAAQLLKAGIRNNRPPLTCLAESL